MHGENLWSEDAYPRWARRLVWITSPGAWIMWILTVVIVGVLLLLYGFVENDELD